MGPRNAGRWRDRLPKEMGASPACFLAFLTTQASISPPDVHGGRGRVVGERPRRAVVLAAPQATPVSGWWSYAARSEPSMGP
jgi:hypothetical protein